VTLCTAFEPDLSPADEADFRHLVTFFSYPNISY
jgi:hypothetical protein